MTFSLRATIREFVAPEHRLSVSSRLWQAGLQELRRRGEGTHESGAFVLGHAQGTRRRMYRFVYYDDLEPHCLESGVVVFNGSGYGPLWQLCRSTSLRVVADIHTHPGLARQSPDDRAHPMVAQVGHIAIIIPCFATEPVRTEELGIYEYEGNHRWHNYLGSAAKRFLYVGRLG
jgi:proteasome lid subunit RPN8/RPN11